MKVNKGATEMEATIKLGDKVRDQVTGLEGVAIARTEWMNKCVRFTVQPSKLKDGLPVDPVTFDEEQLVVIKPAEVKIKKERQTGGDRDFTPSRAKDPRR